METEWEGDLGGPAAWTPAAAALESRPPPLDEPQSAVAQPAGAARRTRRSLPCDGGIPE